MEVKDTNQKASFNVGSIPEDPFAKADMPDSMKLMKEKEEREEAAGEDTGMTAGEESDLQDTMMKKKALGQ